jgi:hypothetical protein
MNIILKLLNIFFVTLGVIFLALILIGLYVWLADPFHVFSLGVSPTSLINGVTGRGKVKVDNIDKNPLLTEDQEAQLESLGVDPAKLPSKITPAMQDCFIDKLEQERANQIVGGGAPTPTDFLKAQSCFSAK